MIQDDRQLQFCEVVEERGEKQLKFSFQHLFFKLVPRIFFAQCIHNIRDNLIIVLLFMTIYSVLPFYIPVISISYMHLELLQEGSYPTITTIIENNDDNYESELKFEQLLAHNVVCKCSIISAFILV